jgi:hypothetical protein
MRFGDAAYQVLKESNKPLTAMEITKLAVNMGLINSAGKTPEASLGRGIYVEIKNEGSGSRFIKVARGVFGLKEWENETKEPRGNGEHAAPQPAEVRLMNEDLSFEAFEKEWLADIITGSPSTIELGRRFSRKLVRQWLDFEEETVMPDDMIYCDGTGDGGIDIAYLRRGGDGEENANGGDTWYLVQSKYGSAFTGTKTILGEAQKLIDTVDGKRDNLSCLAAGLVDRIQTFLMQASERDRIVLVYATQRSLNDGEKRAVEDVRAMGKSRLGSMFETEAVSLETIYNRVLEEGVHVKKTQVPITGHLVPSGEEMLVGAVGFGSAF